MRAYYRATAAADRLIARFRIRKRKIHYCPYSLLSLDQTTDSASHAVDGVRS